MQMHAYGHTHIRSPTVRAARYPIRPRRIHCSQYIMLIRFLEVLIRSKPSARAYSFAHTGLAQRHLGSRLRHRPHSGANASVDAKLPSPENFRSAPQDFVVLVAGLEFHHRRSLHESLQLKKHCLCHSVGHERMGGNFRHHRLKIPYKWMLQVKCMDGCMYG